MVTPDPDVDSIFHFVDISPNAAVVRRAWDFGDDTPSTPTGVSESHTYPNTTATYVVTLSRYNTCDSLTASVTVDVVASGGTK